MYLSTDYFGTRLIIFDNNMNTIGDHFLYQVRGQMHFYSIDVIAEYNLSGSEIICRQVCETSIVLIMDEWLLIWSQNSSFSSVCFIALS